MSSPTQNTAATLAQARQNLEEIQAHIRHLEAQLAVTGDEIPASEALPNDPEHSIGQRLQKIVEQGQEYVALLDAQGHIIYTNQQNIEPTALSQDWLFPYLLHPDDHTKAHTFLQDLQNSPAGTVQTIELRYRHSEGHSIWHEVCATNRLDDAQIAAFVVKSRDITARKHAQNQAQTLFDLLKVTHNTVDFHEALEKILTIMGETMGWDYGDLWIAEPDSPYLVYGRASYLSCSASQALKDFQDYSETYTFKPDEGLIGHVWTSQRVEWIVDLQQDSGSAFRRSDQGRAAHLRGIAAVPIILNQQSVAVLCFYSRDRLNNLESLSQMLMTASEQASTAIERMQNAAALAHHAAQLEDSFENIKKGEESLRQSEARYRSVIDDQTDLICRYNGDLCLTFVNQAYSALYGQQPQEMIGQNFLERIPLKDRARAIAHVKALTITHPVATSEHTSLMPDGTIRWMQWTDRALFDDDGQIVEYQGVGRDITQRKHNEEELARYRDHLAQVVEQRTIELSRAKSRLEAILHNSTEAILLAYPATGIEESNLTFNTLFACSHDCFLGKPLHELIHAEDRNRFNALIHQVMTHQTSQHGEFRARRWDGSFFEAYIGIGFVHPADGDGLVCTIHDISPIKEREQQLRYYASLQENVSDAVIATDLKFVIQSWNRAAETIYGWREEEVLGRTTFEVLRTTYVSENEISQVLKSFMAQGAWRGETQQRRKDNTIIDVLGSVTLIKDENGIPTGVVAVNHDITEQKRAEGALRESESRYRLLADHITDVVARFDMSYTITYISPSSLNALGYTPEEMIGQQVTQFIHPHDSSIVDMAMETIVDGHFMIPSITFRFRHKAGHYLWLESVGRVIVSEKTGEFLGVISSSRDVTERKETEETLGTKFEDERKFQKYLKELHEITIELTQIDQLDEFFREVVNSGLNRLGFERFALFLYDPSNNLAIGTYGTSTEGYLVSEHHILFDFLKSPGILARTLYRAELFSFEEPVTLYTGRQITGQGWSGCAALRNGTQVLGWLVVDNGLYHQAASKPQLEILGLYGIAVGSLLARKQLEVDLRQSEENFRLLAENVTDMITRIDVQGKCVYASPSAQVLLGYTPQEMLNQSVLRFIHPDDAVWMEMLIRAVIEQRGNIPVLTYRLRHKEGHYLWLEADNRTIYAPDGKVVEFVSSSRNITQRKMAEEALRESEEKFRLLVEAAPIAIVISNQGGEITLVNNQAQRLFGYQHSEMISQPIEILIPEMLRDLHTQHRATYSTMPHHMRPSGTGTILFGHRKNGTEFPIEVELSSIETNTGLLVMSFIIDMTTHKAAEDALRQALSREKELNELKSRFVSMASHEFRTPLASILAINESLGAYRSKMTDEHIDKKLARMRDQIEHLNNIMEDVLQLSRLQARRMEFRPTRMNLDALCRSVLEDFQTRSNGQNQWDYQCAESLQDVYLDKKLMRQIMINLVSNAVKYSSKGQLVTLDLKQNENQIIIRVQDQGIGIPESDIIHLFDPFHRATNVETISGTGLGLTIVKESVELHGGTIDIKSEVGVGTAFTLHIPLIPLAK